MNFKIVPIFYFSLICALSPVDAQIVDSKNPNQIKDYEPDWSESASIALGETRSNIYELPEDQLTQVLLKGLEHAVYYPVTISGLYIPYDPLKNFLEDPQDNALKKILQKISQKTISAKTMEDLYKWIGLNPYPAKNAKGIFQIPHPKNKLTDNYMGATIQNFKVHSKNGGTQKVKALTFGCATCHSSTLFGRPIMGLTNKRVRANRFFHLAKQTIPFVPSKIFKNVTGASEAERQLFRRTKYNLPSVGAIVPQALGLDTSLPQVALSLARRSQDEYAEKSLWYQKFPRANALNSVRADSKPMPWWNLKYKTRWLSDGSIVAGNPILTNFLWNELGRGTDLKELEKWMKNNEETIKELTAAAFSMQAPIWKDFQELSDIDIVKAKKGEVFFKQSCQKCHGAYEKGWSLPDSDSMSPKEQVKTLQVNYHERTPVKNVGTDPLRWQGTKHFAEALNDLAISKWMQTEVIPQKGYVPPPLVGIFSRYPYLHNNSIPNLCALMTPPQQRPKTFYVGPSLNAATDFDHECVGYPTGVDIPQKWKQEKDAFFNTKKVGLSNVGHYQMFLTKAGKEKYTLAEKMQLIEFLKTL